jgi:hypothetical protein
MEPGRPRLRGTRTSDRGDRLTLGVDHLDGEVAEHDPRDPVPVKEHGVTGRPLPSGEDVGRLVVEEPVIGLRHVPAWPAA